MHFIFIIRICVRNVSMRKLNWSGWRIQAKWKWWKCFYRSIHSQRRWYGGGEAFRHIFNIISALAFAVNSLIKLQTVIGNKPSQSKFSVSCMHVYMSIKWRIFEPKTNFPQLKLIGRTFYQEYRVLKFKNSRLRNYR